MTLQDFSSSSKVVNKYCRLLREYEFFIRKDSKIAQNMTLQVFSSSSKVVNKYCRLLREYEFFIRSKPQNRSHLFQNSLFQKNILYPLPFLLDYLLLLSRTNLISYDDLCQKTKLKEKTKDSRKSVLISFSKWK